MFTFVSFRFVLFPQKQKVCRDSALRNCVAQNSCCLWAEYEEEQQKFEMHSLNVCARNLLGSQEVRLWVKYIPQKLSHPEDVLEEDAIWTHLPQNWMSTPILCKAVTI
ncbi:hypothetical protein ILYODFUR_037343 [Ilyodon furcidens]|uniref:Uncharacterized protein n=1 Tax=Ilyodon furcidens TaxID=33524 RepID=A0ABV0TEL0_9TELE